jgi:hypothetical protein
MWSDRRLALVPIIVRPHRNTIRGGLNRAERVSCFLSEHISRVGEWRPHWHA